ncbi:MULTISPECIES: hypothetical protein [unclassified Acinetobacter]|uniref:hypothetical protein n=1 Tax=unclassified Acinetobacter TaxID=196816 RepID=UPI0015D2E9A3|nr:MULTISPECIES: hypothetical protein [unclassified Acinetobacter]
MAVPEQTPYSEHTGNGSTTSFALGFQCESKDHLIVLVDEIEPSIESWSLVGGNVVFTTAPAVGKKITLQRNTPFGRTTNYQSFNNSFRPPVVNKDFDWIWLKLQELGVADWILGARIDALKNYVDRKDDELKAYLMEEIRKQGVALDQLDEYYNYLMERLAQIAVQGGWDSSFIAHKDTNQYEINEFIYPKLKREMISIWDFFTAAEYAAYTAAPTTYDASTQVQAFFNAISATDFGKAYCDGNFYVTQGIVFGGNGGSKTKQIIGRLKLTYIGTTNIDTLFTIQPDSGVTWTGGVQVDGAIGNAINYANRKVNHGVLIGGAYNCSHFTIDYTYAWNGFKQWGVWLSNNTTGANIRKIRAYRSGSSMVSGYVAGVTSNFTWVSDKSGTVTQRSVISVSNIIDFTQIKGTVQARIDGELYWLFTTENAGELETYPLLPSTVRSGTLNYIFGGGFYTSGGDASLNAIGNINVSVCANGILLGALYPPFIESATTESNLIGLAIGGSLGSAALGGALGCLYVEANSFNVIENTRADVNFKILNTTVLQDTSRLRHMGDYRLADDRMAGGYKFGTSIRISGVDFEQDRTVTSGTANVDLTAIKEFRKNIICNNRLISTINVSVSNLDSFTKFGTGSARVRFIPTNGVVSPTITINPPADITINGSSDPIVVNNLVGQPEFEFELMSTTSIVMKVKAERAASFTHNPAALGAGLVQSTTFTVTGVKLGDMVIPSFSLPLLGTRIWAEVTAENEVTLYQHNPTASSVDVASGTLTLKLV